MKPTYEELEIRLVEQDNRLVEQEKIIKKLLAEIAQLKDQINKNSKNSSKPPSCDQKRNHIIEKKQERRPYHPGTNRQLLPEHLVTTKEKRLIEICSKCGSSMEPTDQITSWQQVELPEIKPIVHQIDLYTCKCSTCQHLETPQLTLSEQYLMGPRLEALVNLCLSQFRQGHRVVRAFIATLIPELKLSQGVISKVKKRSAKILEMAYQHIANHILDQGDATHVDSTSWRHKARNEHSVILRSGNFIQFAFVSHQNSESIANLVKYRKIKHLVSDRGLAVSKIDIGIHQYCLAHLLRNIQGLAEHPATRLSNTEKLGELYDNLQFLFRDKHRLDKGEIAPNSWKQYGYATWGFMEIKVVEILENDPGDKLRRFCERLLKDWKHFKVYLRNKEFPMTNNPAEEGLRNLVIARKLCFGSRSDYGKKWRENIQSVTETLRRLGLSVLDFLTNAIRSTRFNSPYPVF